MEVSLQLRYKQSSFGTVTIRNTHQLMESDLWTTLVEDKPPGIASDCRNTDVDTDDHVSEKQPTAYERFTTVAWRNTHDGMIGRVEPKRRGRETVSDEVDPK
jgi:hypothetical protein